MPRILGIDPGSRITGYGIIDSRKNGNVHVFSGCIKAGDGPFPNRLRLIFDGVTAVIEEHAPEEIAIETVFMHRNADSALKLGQARGAALCACLARTLPVSEYSPREVKLATVGTGKADKAQVQHMVRVLLNLSEILQQDTADALAVALCHSHSRATRVNIARATGGGA